MTLRAATARDASQVLRLAEQMYASVGVAVDANWRALGGADLVARLGNGLNGWVIDGADGLEACGFVTADGRLPLPSARTARRGYVQWVVTDERHRGQGHATAIMHAIEAWALRERLDALLLHASPHARGLYERLGYRYSHDLDFPPSMLGVPMQRRLSAESPEAAGGL